MRTVPLAAALLASITLGTSLFGCATFGPAVEEPLRVATVDDLSAASLGFRASDTSLATAKATLAARGVTGIVEDAHVVGTAGTLAVLGADYQSRLFLFRDDAFAGELELPTHGLPPYGLAVRVGGDGGAPEILVLYRDPLDRDEEPPTLLLFRGSPTRASDGAAYFHLDVREPLGDLVQRHGGLTRPLLLGDSLAEGILLVARDRDGELWDTGYFLRQAGASIALEPQPMEEAMRCSCVRKYVAGVL